MKRAQDEFLVSRHSRRKVLRAIGATLVAAPVGHLIACGKDTIQRDRDAGNDITDASEGGDASDAQTASVAIHDADVPWASGGTAAMTAAASYPNPFSSGLGAACELYCAATLGPCYAKTLDRKDISEGQPGLPTRLAFRIVDVDCKPLAGATVDVWHCGPGGLYSGEDASDFCTTGDATARAARWFRGVQTTDADGRVDFDTCFPGWYSSRTIHVHFTIRVGGAEYVTSQLVFDDALDDEIVASQDLYDARGARDTQNTSDNVVGGESDLAKFQFETARMSDGAMLAWKTIVVRSSTSDALCQISGAGGMMGGPGGGPGGPPPAGGFGMMPPPGGMMMPPGFDGGAPPAP